MERLSLLFRHLANEPDIKEERLERNSTSSVRSLPRFDSYVLGHYIDDLYDFKQSVYEEFRSRPDLLPAIIEGLTKGYCFVLCLTRGQASRNTALLLHHPSQRLRTFALLEHWLYSSGYGRALT